MSLEILDAAGNVVRAFTQDEIPTERFRSFDNRGYEQQLVTGEPKAHISKGLNRFVWDMRYPSVSSIPGVPPVLIKPIAKPGTYQVRLTVDGDVQIQSFELEMNPNETYSREQTDAKGAFWMQLYAKAEEGVQAVLAAQAAIEAAQAAANAPGASDEVKEAAAELELASTEFIASMVATGRTLVQIISEPTKPLSKLVTLHNVMETSEGPPNAPLVTVYERTAGEIDAAISQYNAVRDEALARLN